ncbi:hypothetical protein ACI3PL_28665, partial [Lacticaseibacillus paracasei]
PPVVTAAIAASEIHIVFLASEGASPVFCPQQFSCQIYAQAFPCFRRAEPRAAAKRVGRLSLSVRLQEIELSGS